MIGACDQAGVRLGAVFQSRLGDAGVTLKDAVENAAEESYYRQTLLKLDDRAEIFDFGSGGQLLYSRRIGRAPQGSVGSSASYSNVPTASTILGALKLTGKSSDGWSVGVLIREMTSLYAAYAAG